jgi:hypothetical protein
MNLGMLTRRFISLESRQLLEIYKDTLALLERFPQDSFYRKSISEQIQTKVKELDPEESCAVSTGVLDKVLQAKLEFALAERMLNDWKPWEGTNNSDTSK